MPCAYCDGEGTRPCIYYDHDDYTDSEKKKVVVKIAIKKDKKPLPNRAITPKEKKEVLNRIYTAWLYNPDMRLGQLIENTISYSGSILFYIEDKTLAVECKAYTKK